MTQPERIQETPDITSQEARQSAAGMVMQLFDHWKLSSADQLMLLGLDESNRGNLTRYRKGSAIENRRDTLERVGMLFELHALLRIIFPENRIRAYGWMTANIGDFDNKTPVDVVREYGYLGLNMLVRYLEKVRGE